MTIYELIMNGNIPNDQKIKMNNVLNKHGNIKTKEEDIYYFLNLNTYDLLKIKNFGRRRLNFLMNELKKHDVYLLDSLKKYKLHELIRLAKRGKKFRACFSSELAYFKDRYQRIWNDQDSFSGYDVDDCETKWTNVEVLADWEYEELK